MPRHLIMLIMACAMIATVAAAAGEQTTTTWQRPADDILEVVHAPKLPWVYTSPTGETLGLVDPILYPSLAELAGPMHKLAGVRVDPELNAVHGRHGGTSPRLMGVEDREVVSLDLPDGSEVMGVEWTVDGERFALTVAHDDHLGLWVGSIEGDVRRIDDVAVNPLLGSGVTWTPDQERLLVRRIPDRGPVPTPPEIPAGPEILTAEGASARSTYEARNLLETAHDDALFDYYMTSELVIVEPDDGDVEVIGEARPYSMARFSPDGDYLLVEYLVAPWSHEVAWWRFASEVEVWDDEGEKVATVASLPVADEVPAQGVPEGPRRVDWRATAPHTLYWVEALDGGDPMVEVDHRDRIMRLAAPFDGEAEEVYRAEHRIMGQGWGAEDATLMFAEYERMRRWLYVRLLDAEEGTARLWYDRDVSDRYGDPGFPIFRPLPSGHMVMHQDGDEVYFRGDGATEEGDRPFLDRRNIETGEVERLFRCPPDRYEIFIDFAGGEDRFVIRSESADDVPNYHLAELDERIASPEGEADWSHTRRPITSFTDPTPQLREIEKRIVQYEREDGVPLSFHLHLPPGHEAGEPLPTVVYAYPLEYSGASTAGQIRGSTQRFSRFWGASHLYFLLRGYAVLHNTAMPMIGDPETVYDTFVEQLVDDAEAAVAKAIAMGIADPERIGVIGHSHGGLMVANLLAHTDLFAAGIARSGSYNKTNQPFGFQSERRSLFEARDVYIQVSPTFFADQVDEPCLIIHGDDDSNPGTLTYQSEVFFEAVRGSGGTARLVLLPHEDHGYRAIESIEHVLWEQLRWFDRYVKGVDEHAGR
ncbi:prolyl oligopeptidase family serine peptidase [bacterium]|nr:prolyl oligopeptidase family serine peptidase [bacterium]